MRSADDFAARKWAFWTKQGASSIRVAKKLVLQITDPAGLSSLPVTDVSEPFKVSNSVEFKSRLAASRGGSSTNSGGKGNANALGQ